MQERILELTHEVEQAHGSAHSLAKKLHQEEKADLEESIVTLEEQLQATRQSLGAREALYETLESTVAGRIASLTASLDPLVVQNEEDLVKLEEMDTVVSRIQQEKLAAASQHSELIQELEAARRDAASMEEELTTALHQAQHEREEARNEAESHRLAWMQAKSGEEEGTGLRLELEASRRALGEAGEAMRAEAATRIDLEGRFNAMGVEMEAALIRVEASEGEALKERGACEALKAQLNQDSRGLLPYMDV